MCYIGIVITCYCFILETNYYIHTLFIAVFFYLPLLLLLYLERTPGYDSMPVNRFKHQLMDMVE